MFERYLQSLKNGSAIVLQACNLISEHKAFYWFAGLLMLSYAAVMGTITNCIWYLMKRVTWTHVTQTAQATVYHGTVDSLTMLNFISTFLMVILVHALWKNLLEIAISSYAAAAMHSDKRSLSIGKALWSALKRSWAILWWVLFNLTVGLAISVISGGSNENKPPIAGALRQLLGIMLSMAWSISTFLVPQVIAFEQTGTFASIKTSFTLIKKTFGEALSANFIFSVFYSLIGIVVMTLTMIFAPTLVQIPSGSLPLFPLLIISVLLLLAAFALALLTVARIIFKTSVYFYAKDNECLGFDASLITQSFR